MRDCVTALLIVALHFVVGCDEWPPMESKSRTHFVIKRASFESLNQKMRESGYWRVSQGVYDDDLVEVTPTSDSEYQDRFTIKDDPEWARLLRETSMYFVWRNDDGVFMEPGFSWGPEEFDGKNGQVGFGHDPKLLGNFCRVSSATQRYRLRCMRGSARGWVVYLLRLVSTGLCSCRLGGFD